MVGDQVLKRSWVIFNKDIVIKENHLLKSISVGSRKLLDEITFCCLCKKINSLKISQSQINQMRGPILLPLVPNPTSMTQFVHLSE